MSTFQFTGSSNQIPAGVFIGLSYRDGCNGKNADSFLIANPGELSRKDIEAAFEHIGTEDIVGMQWGFPNLAPFDHDEEDIGDNDCDHSYMTLMSDIMFLDEDAYADQNKRYPESDENLSYFVAATKNDGSDAYHARSAELKLQHANKAKGVLESQGYKILTEQEYAELKRPTLPSYIDDALLMKAAAIGMSNPQLVGMLQQAGYETSAIYSLQADLTKQLERLESS